jgi:hypothetical protein
MADLFGPPAETRRVVAAYPAGKSAAVYYDARNAGSVVLEPGIWWLFIPILVFAIFLTLLMPAIICADWASHRTVKRPHGAFESSVRGAHIHP